MTFRYEAYPFGCRDMRDLVVPIIEGPNSTREEHTQALAAAKDEVERRYHAAFPEDRLGRLTVYACFDPAAKEQLPQLSHPPLNNSVVY